MDNGIMHVRTYGDPTLRRACNEVLQFGHPAQVLESTLLTSLARESHGAGLAANQIGVGRRAFAYDLTYRGDDLQGVVFNPILEDADGLVVYEEGCLSIPDFFWPVERPEKIVVTGNLSDGTERTYELSGIAARLFQHEMDHLDGLLIFDRLGDPSEAAAARKLAQDVARNPGQWRGAEPSRRGLKQRLFG